MKAAFCFHKVHIMRRTVKQVIKCKKWIIGIHDAVLLRHPALMEGRTYELVAPKSKTFASGSARSTLCEYGDMSMP